MTRLAPFLLLALLSGTVQGQGEPAVRILRPAAIAAVAESLRGRSSPVQAPVILQSLGRHGPYTTTLVRRDRSGQAEIHSRLDDIIVIEEGRGELWYGGEVPGRHGTEAGEERGETVVGGTRAPLQPGDIVIIPAGVPHQVRVPEGGHLTYIAVKVRTP
jgi:mannose-6-phosphate isomerase-like protein (cupin superfamily)